MKFYDPNRAHCIVPIRYPRREKGFPGSEKVALKNTYDWFSFAPNK